MERVRGRGLWYVDGRVECPLAGIGPRGAHASNRLALDDDDTEAHIDRDAKRIVVVNRRRYDRLTQIGDFMLLGEGTTREGRARFQLHMRFDKVRTTVRSRPHLHPTVTSRMKDVVFEPLTVLVSDGTRETVVFEPTLGRAIATNPPVSSWIGRALLTVRDEPPKDALANLVVAAGVGPFARDVVRAEAFALGAGSRASSLRTVLARGAWELRLTALANLRSLREHLARALFLLGIEDAPAVRSLAAEGFRRGDVLSFRLEDGKGTVAHAGIVSPVADATSVARAFLELDFLGAILAERLLRAPAESSPEAAIVL